VDKINTKTLLLFVLFIFSTSLVSAAIDISETDVILEVDYSEFDDQDIKAVEYFTSFKIISSEEVEKTITFRVDNLPTKYNLVGLNPVTLAPGETRTVGFNVNVTHTLGAGQSSIGTIVAMEGETTLDQAGLIQNTKSMLELREIEVDYTSNEDKSERDSFSNEDEIRYSLDKKVRPGSEVEIKFELENLFDKDYDRDGDLENIELKIDADDNDIFDSDFEEDYDLDDMEPDKKQIFTVTFTIDEEAEAKEYILEITLKAEDGKNAEYEIYKELEIDVEREKNDIRVAKSEISPSIITTCDSSFTFDFEIKNFGTKDQKFAGFSIYNKELNINENAANLQLDEFDDRDNEYKNTFVFDLPKNLKAGNYPLDINTYYNRDDISDNEIVNVVIKECDSAVEDPKEETNSNNNNNNDDTTTQNKENNVEVTNSNQNENNVDTSSENTKISSSNVFRSVEDPYSAQDLLIAMIIVGGVLLLSIIIILLVILLRR
jgi:hypothetical protein